MKQSVENTKINGSSLEVIWELVRWMRTRADEERETKMVDRGVCAARAHRSKVEFISDCQNHGSEYEQQDQLCLAVIRILYFAPNK